MFKVEMSQKKRREPNTQWRSVISQKN
jgi:hypothetical protein